MYKNSLCGAHSKPLCPFMYRDSQITGVLFISRKCVPWTSEQPDRPKGAQICNVALNGSFLELAPTYAVLV